LKGEATSQKFRGSLCDMGRSGGGIRQDRSAVGVEEEGYGEGCPLPIRLGERPKLPQRVGRKRFLVHLKPKSHLRHHFKAKPAVFDSKADTPKDIGVPVLKLLRQWPIGVLTPPPMIWGVPDLFFPAVRTFTDKYRRHFLSTL